MAVSQKFELRQRLAPVMTPQLRQAIGLLQLTNVELAAHVEKELDRNPLLERTDPGQEDSVTDDPGDARGREAYQAGTTYPEGETAWTAATVETGVPSWEDAAGPAADAETWIERQEDRPADLSTHLLRQMGLLLDDAQSRRIGRYLVENLDERGYLTVDVDEAARRLGASPESVEAVLETLQACEPTGVFARSIEECLALQLAESGQLDAPMRRLLDNLHLVAGGERARLARSCGVEPDRLDDMLGALRSLDPKPGLSFSLASEPVQAIEPDLILRPAQKSGWRVEMNVRTLPRVMVNRGYYEELLAATRRKKDREYLSERLQEASWLVRAMVQRTATILKVATAIVDYQQAFFRVGPAGLRPLTLREVAEAVDMHESTISRVTSNKYLAAPQGLYPLRYFFSSAIAGADGQTYAGEAVRHRIREIVAAETPPRVLSDQAIAEKLADEGIHVARRTVAKYREAMRIPTSSQRKRKFRSRP